MLLCLNFNNINIIIAFVVNIYLLLFRCPEVTGAD